MSKRAKSKRANSQPWSDGIILYVLIRKGFSGWTELIDRTREGHYYPITCMMRTAQAPIRFPLLHLTRYGGGGADLVRMLSFIGFFLLYQFFSSVVFRLKVVLNLFFGGPVSQDFYSTVLAVFSSQPINQPTPI